ncbi:MSC_0620 family F1-like ATPase-associated subunit [Mycoplasma sp. 6243]|uniref:MSC_0620 family F1-like ATPase-associated subunit n=1 Tax=Mycoplasma sp. 6243 TaxID=3440865 RepID=UPI003EB88E97
MSKKWKKILNVLSLATATMTPIISLSTQNKAKLDIKQTDGEENPSTPDNPGTPSDPNNPPEDPRNPKQNKPRDISPDFDTFRTEADDKFHSDLKPFLDNLIQYLQNERDKEQKIADSAVNPSSTTPETNPGVNTQNPGGQGNKEQPSNPSDQGGQQQPSNPGAEPGKGSEEQKPKDDYRGNRSKITYLDKLIKFFSDHKDDIAANPEKYGMNAIFPKVISRDKYYDYATVKFNGKDYTDIKVGKSDPTNYEKAIEGNDQNEINIDEKRKDEKNTINKTELDTALNKYINKLKDKIPEIFMNPEDITKIGKDVEVVYDPKTDSYTVTPPKGFKTWDEYFINKIKPRYTAFDLEANKDIEIEPKQQPPQNNQVTPPDSAAPNTNPNLPEQPNDALNPPINPQELILQLPPLFPNISYKLYNPVDQNLPIARNDGEDLGDYLYRVFNDQNVSQEVKDSLFFFDNPINIRYRYRVVKLEKPTDNARNSLIPTIEIQDLLDPKLKREYQVAQVDSDANKTDADKDAPSSTKYKYLDTTDDETHKRFNFLYQGEIKALKEKFEDLYKAVGIEYEDTVKDGDNEVTKTFYLDYDKLNFLKDVRTAIFSMVAYGVQFTATEKPFNIQRETLLNDPKFTVINTSDYDKVNAQSIKTSSEAVMGFLFRNLKGSSVESKRYNGPYFSHLAQAYKDELTFILLALKNDQVRKTVEENFKQIKANTKVFNDFIKQTEVNINKLLQYSQSQQPTFNIITWYDNYVNLVKEIGPGMLALKQLIIANKLPPTPPEEDQSDADKESQKTIDSYQQHYQLIDSQLQKFKQPDNNLLTILGILFLATGSILVALNSVGAIINRLKRNNQLKTIYIIAIVAIILFLAIGSVFLGIGLKGI